MLGRRVSAPLRSRAPDEGQRYFEQAAELADEPSAQAQLLERAGEAALNGEPLGRGPGAHSSRRSGCSSRRATRVLPRAPAPARRRRRYRRPPGRGGGPPRARRRWALRRRARCRTRWGARAARPHACTRRAQRGGVAHARARVAAARSACSYPTSSSTPSRARAVVLTYQDASPRTRILLQAALARAFEEHLYASALRAMNNLGVVHHRRATPKRSN